MAVMNSTSLLEHTTTSMKFSSMIRVLVLAVLLLFGIAVSHTSTQVDARPAPGFGQRRLLNLSGNSVEPTEVPESLLVAPGNSLHIVLRGDGVQEYLFENGTWNNVNASATLYTFSGQEVGEHYFLSLGSHPTWKTFSPVSIVTGVASVKETVTEDAIPWVLLNSTDSTGSSSDFGTITYVQRLYTENGLPPDISYSATPGEQYKSPYTAVYFFYING